MLYIYRIYTIKYSYNSGINSFGAKAPVACGGVVKTQEKKLKNWYIQSEYYTTGTTFEPNFKKTRYEDEYRQWWIFKCKVLND